jgi:hypothetical protein
MNIGQAIHTTLSNGDNAPFFSLFPGRTFSVILCYHKTNAHHSPGDLAQLRSEVNGAHLPIDSFYQKLKFASLQPEPVRDDREKSITEATDSELRTG